MRLDKKGISLSLTTIAIIVVSLAVLGILVFSIRAVAEPLELTLNEQLCKKTVELSSLGGTIAEKAGLDAVCYTDYIESKAISKDEALEDMAERMRRCWVLWGEGRLNPEGKKILGFSENKCFTCYKLRFPDLKEKITMNEFLTYLRTNDKDIDGENSYLHYFKKSNLANVISFALPGTEGGNIILSDTDYAVAYIEHVNPGTITHLVIGTTVGKIAAGGVCFFTSGGLLCATGGTIAGIAAIGGVPQVDKFLDLLKSKWGKSDEEIFELEKGTADGIFFGTFKSAKDKCSTVIRMDESENERK